MLRLQKIRQALERGALVLYAQPIRDAQGKGYDEILTRLSVRRRYHDAESVHSAYRPV
ncbi:protein YfeA [Salmonella enterica subsp. enterica]|uniref:Protein YfeA n=1 Tax=Salmonella enterica I TaxID=59201 RepID=A0A447TYQ4_SALET|nr:protein YfeA [Salmonella enterica subsp. enterica]